MCVPCAKQTNARLPFLFTEAIPVYLSGCTVAIAVDTVFSLQISNDSFVSDWLSVPLLTVKRSTETIFHTEQNEHSLV